jgi:hypothetical protein
MRSDGLTDGFTMFPGRASSSGAWRSCAGATASWASWGSGEQAAGEMALGILRSDARFLEFRPWPGEQAPDGCPRVVVDSIARLPRWKRRRTGISSGYILYRNRAVKFRVETEREMDGRWIAEVRELPGVLAYGGSEREPRLRSRRLRCALSLTGWNTARPALSSSTSPSTPRDQWPRTRVQRVLAGSSNWRPTRASGVPRRFPNGD